jgi:bifunctional non-homologous end joining protein LigD
VGGLDEYHRKRNFRVTAEPRGKVKRKRAEGGMYVIQKHAASRLHYDFRLELDGTLKSWAVPKGPSLDPSQKRLAVHVEDHPIQYGSFEGTIPKGEYGGGTVMLWDKGRWEPMGDPRSDYRKGKLKFRLRGKRLTGGWTLVQMHGPRSEEGKNWLLIKDRFGGNGRPRPAREPTTTELRSVQSGRSMEEIARKSKRVWHSNREEIDPSTIDGARRAKMPMSLRPQLATLVKEIPSNPGWLHEIKFDGYRIISFIQSGKLKLVSRNQLDWTRKLPTIVEALKNVPVESAILDGEVVVLNEKGVSDFQSMQQAFKKGSNAFVYFLFDLLYLNGYDLTLVSLIERKKYLASLLSDSESSKLKYSDHIEGSGTAFYKNACRMALEGVVSKKMDSPYVPRRSREWAKVKCSRRQEFVIAGYSAPGGSRSHFGSLILGYNENGSLKYAGRVGTGFTETSLSDLSRRLSTLRRAKPPFNAPLPRQERKNVQWVEPKLVAEVEFTEWTDEGSLRHPSFKGLREDKPPTSVRKEVPLVQKKSSKVAGVQLTHPDKVFYPEQGITKRELAEYYEAAAPWILPYLKRRPLSVVRCPEGHQKECFYQKHPGATFGEAIHEIPVKEKGSRKTEKYLGVADEKGLITLIQMGVLEIHPWGSREENLERPDTMIFDLDPDPDVEWIRVVQTAFLLREKLNALKLTSFLKTSGGKGLHIVVPLVPKADWNGIRTFSQALAQALVAESPKEFVATMSKAKRHGKIFIDYFRNTRGATNVAPYSTRARKGAPVSAPIAWEELTPNLSPQQFNVGNMKERWREIEKKDPWRHYFSIKQSIDASGLRGLN